MIDRNTFLIPQHVKIKFQNWLLANYCITNNLFLCSVNLLHKQHLHNGMCQSLNKHFLFHIHSYQILYIDIHVLLIFLHISLDYKINNTKINNRKAFHTKSIWLLWQFIYACIKSSLLDCLKFIITVLFSLSSNSTTVLFMHTPNFAFKWNSA